MHVSRIIVSSDTRKVIIECSGKAALWSIGNSDPQPIGCLYCQALKVVKHCSIAGRRQELQDLHRLQVLRLFKRLSGSDAYDCFTVWLLRKLNLFRLVRDDTFYF